MSELSNTRPRPRAILHVLRLQAAAVGHSRAADHSTDISVRIRITGWPRWPGLGCRSACG